MNAAMRRQEVLSAIGEAEREAGRPAGSVTLVAVSKTFDAREIVPVIAAGQRVFGENRVQEAMTKWAALKERHGEIELRLIGRLQSNKAASAVALFDVIETVDREKIARVLAEEMRRQGRSPRLHVQVNTGEEPQKAGVAPGDTACFVADCRTRHGLAIDGLMCIPPAGENPGPHFALLEKLAGEVVGVRHLSMGMSADFREAVAFGATSVRLGSAIFGARS